MSAYGRVPLSFLVASMNAELYDAAARLEALGWVRTKPESVRAIRERLLGHVGRLQELTAAIESQHCAEQPGIANAKPEDAAAKTGT